MSRRATDLHEPGSGRYRLELTIALVFLFNALSAPANAEPELTGACVVSILNRVAVPRPDGSYLLPNTPSNIGRVRARATCLVDGVTHAGQSAYFDLSQFTSPVRVPPIVFGATEPVPDPNCADVDLAGAVLGETVTTDNGCGEGTVQYSKGCPVKEGNALGCTGVLALCLPASDVPAGGCTETFTQRLSLGDADFRDRKITFRRYHDDSAGCLGIDGIRDEPVPESDP